MTGAMRPDRTVREESGTFDLLISVEGIGKTVEWTSGRAMELGHAAEEWLTVKPNWKGSIAGLKWLQIEGDGALVEAFNDKGSLAELTYPIAYQARLD